MIPGMKTVNILLADDHEVMRRGLRALLESQPGWRVCGEAATGRLAVQKAVALKPDVVVMDIAMPELNGLEALRQIRKAGVRSQVLIFTVHETEQLVHEVFKAGARGFVLKSEAARHLLAAVESLSEKRPYFASKVGETVLQGYLRAELPPMMTISPRECEVLQLIAEGKSSKEAARMLGCSVRTIETHRGVIMQKLRLHTLPDLVRYAIRNKIIDVD